MNKTIPSRAFLILLLAGLVFSSSKPMPIPVTRALTEDRINPAILPAVPWASDFSNFRESLASGDPDQVVGVYAPRAFSYPVVQQPDGQPNYVSVEPGVVTQFSAASRFGTIGLLAHDNLAGEAFYQLAPGETFFVLYGNGRVAAYWIQAIRVFQALTPDSPFSQFVDQDNPDVRLASSQVFSEIYAHPDQAVLQTCLGRDGDPSWGRIFVIGTPRSMEEMLNIPSYQSVFTN